MEYRSTPPTRAHVRGFQLFLGLAITLGGFYVMMKFDEPQPEVLIGSIVLICVGLFVGKMSFIPED